MFSNGYQFGLIQHSYKIWAALLLLEKSLARGDRVLIFRCGILPTTFLHLFVPETCTHTTCSQSLGTLDTLEYLLNGLTMPAVNGVPAQEPHLWRKGTDYLRMCISIWPVSSGKHNGTLSWQASTGQTRHRSAK